MKLNAIILVVLLFCGCKSVEKTTVLDYNVKLSNYIKMYSDKGFITNDPLIIVNSKPYKMYSELNDDDLELMEQPARNYSYFKQKNNYFIDKLGERAYYGIVHIKSRITLYCGSPCKREYIVNDKMIHEDLYMDKYFLKKFKYQNSISRLELGDNNYISVTVIETK